MPHSHLLPYWDIRRTMRPMALAGTVGYVPVWTLADRLVKARHVAGLTQEALARRLGISKKTVVRGEGGGTIKSTAAGRVGVGVPGERGLAAHRRPR
jgi:hypothetical protein